GGPAGSEHDPLPGDNDWGREAESGAQREWRSETGWPRPGGGQEDRPRRTQSREGTVQEGRAAVVRGGQEPRDDRFLGQRVPRRYRRPGIPLSHGRARGL